MPNDIKMFLLNDRCRSSLPLYVGSHNPCIMHETKHMHDCYEMMFIQTGTGWCSINEKHYPMIPGDLYFMKIGDTHEFFIGHKTVYFTIMFNDEIFVGDEIKLFKQLTCPGNQMADSGEILPKMTFKPSVCDSILNILKEVSYELQSQHTAFEYKAKALFMQFLIMLIRNSSDSHALPCNTDFYQFSTIFNYIEQHYMEKITIEKLASIAKIAPNYLGRQFKHHTGINISDYIILFRIEKARKKLENFTSSITETAFETGFCDSSHFTKTFKKIIGMSPKQYRNFIKNNPFG